MYKPKLVSKSVGKFSRSLMSGLSKFMSYEHGNYSSNVEEYPNDLIINQCSQEALNRAEFYKGLATQMVDRRRYI